jgi:3-oxoacyl-[acyl-carrier-protein] synthase-3
MFDRNMRIIGTGRYIPKRKVDASELDKIMGVDEGTCLSVTGVETRYWIDNETSSEMGAYAAKEALARAGIKPEQLDVIVSTCGVNEQPIPTGACLLSEKLGLQNSHIQGFDVNSSCMSFLQGLDVISSMMQLRRYNLALICSADITSGGINYTDLKSCPLFSDGAAAMVVTMDNTGNSGVITSHFETYSKGAHLSEIKGGGTKLHPMKYNAKNHYDFIYELHGIEMAKVVFAASEDFFERALNPIGMNLAQVIDDMTILVPHQVSPSFVRNLQRKLNIPDDKIINLTKTYGNMLSVSVPLGIDEVISTGRIKRGDKMLIFGGGSGISLGIMYLQY